MKQGFKKKILEYLIIAFLSFCMAVIYEILIFPNAFAPAGINGLATIIQHLFDFSVGYMSIIINIPLVIIAFIWDNKDFAIKTLCYVLIFSLFTLVLKNGDTAINGDGKGFINLEDFIYKNSTVSIILAPIVSGALNGIIYGFSIRHNTCTGGTDIVARLVKKKHPELNIMWLTFALNSIVAILSYFAYSQNGKYDLQPVILCIIYCFTSSKMGDLILKGYKNLKWSRRILKRFLKK